MMLDGEYQKCKNEARKYIIDCIAENLEMILGNEDAIHHLAFTTCKLLWARQGYFRVELYLSTN